MKKTRILSVVALASLMAACSNEEIAVLENNAQKQDLSIRPLVENTTILDGVESRMAVTGAYRPQFADGDKLGAVLIDEPTYADQVAYAANKEAGKTAEELYNIVEKMYSNYPYERVEGAWYTQAALVEGNYMFYAPFNEANSFVRSNPVVKLPKIQTVSSKTSAIEEFAASGEIVKVGYAFMDAEGSMKPVVAMQDVFAYPLITLKNNFKGYLFDDRAYLASGNGVPTLYEGEIKVDSIQIISDADVVVEASLKYANTTDIAPNVTSGLVYKLRDTDGANTNPWYVDWTEAYTGDILGTANKVERKVLTTLVLGKTLAKGAVETFNVVLPAEEYGDNLGALVFVTIGDKQYQINGGVMLTNTAWTAADPKLAYSNVEDKSVGFTSVATTGVTLIKAQQYPAEVYNTNGTVKEGADELMTINLVGGVVEGYATAESASDITPNTEAVQAAFEWDPETPSAVGIANNTELINWFKNTVKNTILTEVVTPANNTEFNLLDENEVIINAALIDALAEYNGNRGAIKFTSLLPIADDVIMNSATVSGTEAEVEFMSLVSEETFKVTIPVKNAAASITENGNYVLSNTAVGVVNSGDEDEPLTNVNLIVPTGVSGTINLSTITDAGYISAIYNLNVLTINSDMDGSTLNVFNGGELTLATGYKTNAKIYNAGKFNNNGLMMVAGTNNNEIVSGIGSTTKIAAGEGSVNNTNLATVTVTGGTQTVYYNHTANTDWTAQNTAALATTGINKIVVDGDLAPADADALTKPFKNCSVTEIEFKGTTFDATAIATADLTGKTIKFTATSGIALNGTAAGTTLTGCTFVSNQDITLSNVNATGSISPITEGAEVKVVVGAWSSWN